MYNNIINDCKMWARIDARSYVVNLIMARNVFLFLHILIMNIFLRYVLIMMKKKRGQKFVREFVCGICARWNDFYGEENFYAN